MRKIKIVITFIITISLASYFFLNRWTKASDISTYNPNTGNASITTNSSDGKSDNHNKNNSDKYTYIPPVLEYDNKEEKHNGDVKDIDEYNVPSEPQMTPTTEIALNPDWTPATEIDLDHESLTVLINKELTLPEDYIPANMVVPDVLFDINYYDDKMLMRPEAARALEILFADAHKEGHKLYAISGYRSYKRQYDIFTKNLVDRGKAQSIKYSAIPGTSEHQTGLAMDVSLKSLSYRLITPFSRTAEGRWLTDNAHYYGYIIRYQKDTTDITGYAYEPWHIRFVGLDLANYLYTNNLTLEEYYNYIPSEDYDFETKHAEILSFKPTPTPIPEEALEGDDLDPEKPDYEDMLLEDLDENDPNDDLPDDEDILDTDNNPDGDIDEENDLVEDNLDEDCLDENYLDEDGLDVGETDYNGDDIPDENIDEPIIINPNTGKPVRDSN